ncbi:unnamed protein product [Meloidogyne enterolobii]|uniref:Uncharacterized protein n=1 Tax=Meloidogyne enterolobii TaxID=390850 RepID=A0ACB0ZHM1_MELEN
MVVPKKSPHPTLSSFQKIFYCLKLKGAQLPYSVPSLKAKIILAAFPLKITKQKMIANQACIFKEK